MRACAWDGIVAQWQCDRTRAHRRGERVAPCPTSHLARHELAYLHVREDVGQGTQCRRCRRRCCCLLVLPPLLLLPLPPPAAAAACCWLLCLLLLWLLLLLCPLRCLLMLLLLGRSRVIIALCSLKQDKGGHGSAVQRVRFPAPPPPCCGCVLASWASWTCAARSK